MEQAPAFLLINPRPHALTGQLHLIRAVEPTLRWLHRGGRAADQCIRI